LKPRGTAPKRRFDRAEGGRPARSEFKPRGERSEGQPQRNEFRKGAPRDRRFDRPEGERLSKRFEDGASRPPRSPEPGRSPGGRPPGKGGRSKEPGGGSGDGPRRPPRKP
jgi:hypothetical protein